MLFDVSSWYFELQFETWSALPTVVETFPGEGRRPTNVPVAMFCSMHNDYSAVVEWAAELLMLTSTTSLRNNVGRYIRGRLLL